MENHVKDKTERNATEVIDSVLALLPESMVSLKKYLLVVKDSAGYVPPDENHLVWYSICSVLNHELPIPPVEDWQKEIYRIVTLKDPNTGMLLPSHPQYKGQVE